MGRSLLDAAPMWALGVAFVLIPALGALLLGVLVRRRWPRAAQGAYKETGSHLLTQTLAIYGLVLAFVIVNQYGDYNQTRKEIQTEALNVEDLQRASQLLEPRGKAEVSQAIGVYVRRVVDEEWSAMSSGTASPRTAAAFTELYDVLGRNAPRDPGALLAYSNASAYLHSAHDARHRRVDAATDTLPSMLMAFLLLGALASVGATLLLGMRNSQLVVPMALAGLLGFTLLLSLSLDHPFTGDSGLSSVHFTQGALAPYF